VVHRALQTERDKARLLDGLAGAAAGALDTRRSRPDPFGLGKRVFLLHNVHESAPVVFQTRWAMSYLPTLEEPLADGTAADDRRPGHCCSEAGATGSETGRCLGGRWCASGSAKP
jgi:hypothetical protein